MRRLVAAWLAVGLTLGAAWFGATRWGQDAAAGAQTAPARDPAALSVQDALLRPATIPFRVETTLEAVAETLRQMLKAPVVLDRAALGRQGLTPGSTVQLDLENVRLKTGLELLLDQVGLTYRVVPEDNLLVLTDQQGADDVNRRVLTELQALHREVHDLQDLVNDLYDRIEQPESAPGPTVREPTIIEEVPKDKAEPKPDTPPARTRPG